VPEAWSQAKRAQMDCDGQWTIKRGRRRPAGAEEPQARGAGAIAMPVLGYKNHLGIDTPLGRFFEVSVWRHRAANTPPGHRSPTGPDGAAPRPGCWSRVRMAARIAPPRCIVTPQGESHNLKFHNLSESYHSRVVIKEIGPIA
jgi:hypothetical protein